MHIAAGSATEIATPEGTIRKYPMTPEAGLSHQVLTTSSPASGKHLNREVHEIYFIIGGTATFVVGEERYEVGEKDIVIVEPMSPHSIETEGLTYVTITQPNWFYEQYEHVQDE